jgi:excisionase family DNA binding protein
LTSVAPCGDEPIYQATLQRPSAKPVMPGTKGSKLDTLTTESHERVLRTPHQSTIEKLLTAEELSSIIRLHPVTILRWARQGRIPHRRLSPRKVLFLASEINAWLASGSNLYTEPATRAASTEKREAA